MRGVAALAAKPAQVYSVNRRPGRTVRAEFVKETIMSKLIHRLAAAHAGLRTAALGLAAVVTLGSIGVLDHLADTHYIEALVSLDLFAPDANYVQIKAPRP